MVRRLRSTIQESSVVRAGRLKALEWAEINLDGYGPPARKIVSREEVVAARAKAYAWAEQNGLIPSAPEYDREEDEPAGDDFPRRRTGFGPPILSAPGPFAPEKRDLYDFHRGTTIPSAPFVAPDDRDEDESAGNYFHDRAGSWSAEF
jgi:hypothetical protein